MQSLENTTGFFEKKFEIKSDDQTVWVNHDEKCVARFSEDEVQVGITDFEQPIFERSNATRARQPIGTYEWHQFQRLMKDCYGFILGDEWTPQWMQKKNV